MKAILFPEFNDYYQSLENAPVIFDPVRKKNVSATPEEKVRQFILQHMIFKKNYPRALVAVEAALKVNRLQKRCDLLAYKNSMAALLVECKAPSVKITQNVFEQAARYNLTLRVPYILVTNGLIALCCKIDLLKGEFEFLAEIPDYGELVEVLRF